MKAIDWVRDLFRDNSKGLTILFSENLDIFFEQGILCGLRLVTDKLSRTEFKILEKRLGTLLRCHFCDDRLVDSQSERNFTHLLDSDEFHPFLKRENANLCTFKISEEEALHILASAPYGKNFERLARSFWEQYNWRAVSSAK